VGLDGARLAQAVGERRRGFDDKGLGPDIAQALLDGAANLGFGMDD
jgi:hypothetical protein